MSDQTNFITGITVPGLTSIEYAEGLNNAFNNINNNFTTLANQDFAKGEDGSSVSVEYINIFDKKKDEYTEIGNDLIKAITKGYDKSVSDPIDEVLYDKLLRNDDTKVGMITDANGKYVSSLYFVFLDARYARSDLSDTIKKVSNNSSESDSSNNQSHPYTNAVDLSCVLIYNGQTQTFERLDNAFPTMYYTPGVGMCWKLYGENTGIPVQGLPGAKGQSSSIAIARCSELKNSSDGNQTLSGTVDDLLIGGTYTKTFSDEQLQEYDGQTVLIIGPKHDDVKGESFTDFYFGALTRNGSGFDVTTAYDKPWTSYVEATAVVNLLRSINIYRAQDTNGEGEVGTNSPDNTIKIPGLFVPIHTDDDKQSAHLITATNLTGSSTDAYASDMLIAPIDDIDNINSSKTLGISDPMYVERKVSVGGNTYIYDRYDDVNKFVWKNDDSDADEKYIYTKTINPTIGDEYEIEYSMGDTAPGDSPLSSYTTTLKGFNAVEDNQKKGALCIAEDVNIVNEGDDKPHNLSVSGNVFCDAIGCVNKLTVNGGANITGATTLGGKLTVNGGANITGPTNITGVTKIQCGLNSLMVDLLGVNITGLTTLNTGLNVSGATTLNAGLIIPNTQSIQFRSSNYNDKTDKSHIYLAPISNISNKPSIAFNRAGSDGNYVATIMSYAHDRGNTYGCDLEIPVKTYFGNGIHVNSNNGIQITGNNGGDLNMSITNAYNYEGGSTSMILKGWGGNVAPQVATYLGLWGSGNPNANNDGKYGEKWLICGNKDYETVWLNTADAFTGPVLVGYYRGITVDSGIKFGVKGNTYLGGNTYNSGTLKVGDDLTVENGDKSSAGGRSVIVRRTDNNVSIRLYVEGGEGKKGRGLYDDSNKSWFFYTTEQPSTNSKNFTINFDGNDLTSINKCTVASLTVSSGGASITGELDPGTDATYDIGYSTSSKRWRNLYLSGSANAAAFYQSSDNRLKDFEDTIPVDLEKLRALKKNYFTWKDNENKDRQIGVSAQEIQEIYPELVSANEDGMLSVAYDKLSVVALAAIDKLYEENKALEDRIKVLEDKFEALLSRINY